MTLLLIGGTGVLSSAVTTEALKKGIKVTMINRGNRKIPDGVELIKADKDDFQTIERALAGRIFDAVMDFLCYTDIQTEKSARFYMNYTKQYFYISSCAVYDTATLNGKASDEGSKKVLPIWQYSVDKWSSEQKIEALFKDTESNYTIIRPCVTYGDTRIPYGISPSYGYHWTLCARILSGKPIITWNQGRNRCNMTRVEDFAVGVVSLIGNPKAYKEAFNVCGDETPSFRNVLETLSEYLHKPLVTVDVSSEFYAKELPNRAGEIMGGRSIDTINSNTKLKAIVPEYKQNVFLKEGITKTLDAYKAQGYQHGIEWSFDADTDRIVKKWCKKNGIDEKQYNLGFVDYLGTASKLDKIKYWAMFHHDNCFVAISIKLLLLTLRVINNIKK